MEISIDLSGVLKAGFRDALLRLKSDPDTYRRADAAADKLSLGRNANRLATFYHRVVADSKMSGGIRLPLWVRQGMLLPGIGRPLWQLERQIKRGQDNMRAGRNEKAVRLPLRNEIARPLRQLVGQIRSGQADLMAGLQREHERQQQLQSEITRSLLQLNDQIRSGQADLMAGQQTRAGATAAIGKRNGAANRAVHR